MGWSGSRTGMAGMIVMIVMILVIIVAFALRVVYAIHISPFSDEYITMLAARSVLETGWPVLPSGLFYDHGILYVYLSALFLGCVGFTVDVARLTSAFVGVATVALTYTVGRRWFSRRTGVLAAWLLTWGSADIVWHGRARMYVLVQFAFLMGVFLLYEGLVRKDSRSYRCWGVVSLAAAMLAHILAIPYGMTMGCALALVRGWVRRRGRSFRLPVRRLWPELSLAAVGVGLVAAARSVGGPWGAGGRVVTDWRVLLNVGYVVGHVLAWMRLFLTGPALVWMVFVVVGLLTRLLTWWRGLRHPDLSRGQMGDLPWMYLLLIWLGSLVGLGVFSVWYADNYVIGLTPLFYLLAARELNRMAGIVEEAVGRMGSRRRAQWEGTVVLIVVVALLAAPTAVRTVREDPLQLDQALDFVRRHWQAGDVVATFAPHASLLTVGEADFYAQESGYPFLETPTGRVDIWTGTPVLDSVEGLDDLLGEGRRVWLIVHRENWQRHYSEAYRAFVERRMDVVFDGTGTRVYLFSP